MFNIPTQRLAKVTVTEPVGAVTLSVNPIVEAALSFTPRHLLLRVDAKSTTAATVIGGRVQLNGDTASNYNSEQLYSTGTTPAAANSTSSSSFYFGGLDGSDSNEFGGGELLIPDALSTRTHKSFVGMTAVGDAFNAVVGGRWNSTAAVTSVTYFPSAGNLDAGSTIELCVVDESFNINEQIKTGSGTFTVSSISAADGDLVVIGNLRSNRTAYSGDNAEFHFNGDTSVSNYHIQVLQGYQSSVQAYSANASWYVFSTPSSASTANVFGAGVAQIANFSDGSNDRAITAIAGWVSGSGAGGSSAGLTSTRWNNTAAINSILVVPSDSTSYVANSMLSTYAVPKNQITRTELGSAAASVTFSSIPQTYDHLEVSWYANSDENVTALRGVSTTFNGDTGANYSAQVLEGTGTGTGAASLAGQTSMGFAALTEGKSGAANEMSSGSFTIQNYTKTDRYKNLLAGYGVNQRRVQLGSNRWHSTAAVTSITLTQDGSGSFIAGSVFTLRGINAAPAAATDIETINGIAAANIEAVN